MRVLFSLAPVFISTLFLLNSQSAYAKGTQKDQSFAEEFSCYTERKLDLPYSICYRQQQYTNSDDIVYFLHAEDTDEKALFKSTTGMPMVQRIWDSEGYRPRIVSISFGRRKLLLRNFVNKEHLFFLTKALPFIENEYGGLRNGKRHIIGQSMGAVSAINLTLRKDVFFNTTSLLCPAFSDLNPYASEKEIFEYSADKRIQPDSLRSLLRLQKENYLNRADWINNSPRLLLSKFGKKNMPRIYVSAGGDSFGYKYGIESFLVASKGLGFSPQWEPVNGAHCSFRTASFAKFIMEEARK